MIHIGIDLHTHNMVNVAINDNAEVIRQAKMPACPNSLDLFLDDLQEPVQAVVECTSSWYWISDWFREHHIPLKLAHAKMVKAISYAKVKTDKVDARTLAELLRVGLIPEAYQVQPEQRELRELTRGRLRMIQRRGSLQSSLWNLGIKYNIRITEEIGWRYPSQLLAWVTPQLPVSARVQSELIIEDLVRLQGHIHTLEKAIEQMGVFTRELELMAPIPGMGMVGSWTVLAEMGDIHRFPCSKQFVSYCRLVPGSKDSGGSRKHKSGCKDGNKYLRMAFGQAAVSGYTHYGPVKKFYNKIKRRSGKQVARAVVAKELANIVWHVLVKNEPYKGFKGQPTRVAQQAYWPQPINPFA